MGYHRAYTPPEGVDGQQIRGLLIVCQVKQEYVYAPTGPVDGTLVETGEVPIQSIRMETDDGTTGEIERLKAELQVERVLHEKAREDVFKTQQIADG